MSNSWDSPGQNTGMVSLSLLQGIFPTQGLNSGLPYCRQILYQLSHKGNPNKRQSSSNRIYTTEITGSKINIIPKDHSLKRYIKIDIKMPDHITPGLKFLNRLNNF